MIQQHFLERIAKMEHGDVEKIAKNLDKDKDEIIIGTVAKKLDMMKILDIDTILISSRHLYRMPYSLHEKSGLASVPVDPDKILEFTKASAAPDKVIVDKQLAFLKRDEVISGEARELFDKATHLAVNKKEVADFESSEDGELEIPAEAIPVEFFPPAILNMLKGLKDGKKRAMFVLVNFLSCVGWKHEDIEKLLIEWNKKNEEPLRDTLIVGQIRYHKMMKKKVLPPNYSNNGYYAEIGVLSPEEKDGKFKNPVAYAKHRLWMHTNDMQRQKKPKKEKAEKPVNDKPDAQENNSVSEYRKFKYA
jgi:hypothetical protein